jgi:hypothetical protein
LNRPATKTDNSFLETKIRLRIDNLPDDDVHVLDCFSGSGRIWKRIKAELPDRDIQVLSIEKKRQGGIYLQGDNVKFLSSIDLGQFNVIDLDAWGVPYRQLKTIFARQTRPGVVVFVTFCQSIFGRLPFGLLRDIGYSAAMIRKCPTLFNRNGFSKFRLWLAMQGIEQIKSYNRGQKHYLCFQIKKSDVLKFEKMQTYGKVRKKAKKRIAKYTVSSL